MRIGVTLMAGAIAGAAVGGAGGLLFAPRPGSESRASLKKRVDRLARGAGAWASATAVGMRREVIGVEQWRERTLADLRRSGAI